MSISLICHGSSGMVSKNCICSGSNSCSSRLMPVYCLYKLGNSLCERSIIIGQKLLLVTPTSSAKPRLLDMNFLKTLNIDLGSASSLVSLRPESSVLKSPRDCSSFYNRSFSARVIIVLVVLRALIPAALCC